MSRRRFVWPVIGLIALVVFLVAAVFPTRTYLHQQDEIAAEQKRLEVLSAENRRLAARVDQLHTDAEIERLAREQYNLVRPGEEAYAILPGPADPQPERVVPDEPTPPPAPSWWDRTADSLTFWD